MNDIPIHTLAKPDRSISDFVYCFSSIQNLSEIVEGVIIPNGRIDLSFYKTSDGQFHISLLGLETKPKLTPGQSISAFFAINFNPLAVEYILGHSVADILDKGKSLPNDFWDFSIDSLNDFDAFCEKATQKIQSLLPKDVDERKRKLFALVFETNGEIAVKELSERVAWSSRQINQYFNQQFGISLKVYCNILRFQASLSHIKEGKLFPQLNYYDQSHFIKEIKKLSGASPKELFKNENGRFLQFLITDKR
ncbi:Helix-turn-helix domain-containing protein [Pedobacter sp. ok626]|uniref:helix-turn-helix domain-containing protein n=1 Tax=Pedobacter sp. ok626 TaxID=1761882 RepID=UPI00087E3847|nr:AraC family transcriptional regulator [Pedobacter sp. ok626]SDK13022.1 Helix-turn-helix domain-containing protein [Pedobacter sp. ok626]